MGLLRFLLALSVLLNHFQYHYHISILGYQIVGGEVAVVAFFIISGFYMSLILNEKYIGKHSSFFLYISNRFLRIYPLYWLMLGLTFIYFRIIDFKMIEYIFIFPNPWLNFLNLFQSIVQNLFLFTTLKTFVSIPSMYSLYIVDPAWSLGIEITFYLLAPLLVKGGMKKVVFLLVLSELLRIMVTHVFHLYPAYSLPFLFLPNLFFFMLGATSYQVYRKLRQTKLDIRIYYGMAILVFSFLLLYNVIPYFFFYTFKRYLLYTLITIGTPFLFSIEKKIKFSFFLGELSYPIYISHMLLIGVMSHIPFLAFSTTEHMLMALFIIFIISYLLKRYIADPIDKYREKRVKKKK